MGCNTSAYNSCNRNAAKETKDAMTVFKEKRQRKTRGK